MRPRQPESVDVDHEVARREIRMLRMRAGVYALRARRNGHHSHVWWSEAARRLQELSEAEVPDLAAAKRAFRAGYHVTDEQASAEGKGYRR